MPVDQLQEILFACFNERKLWSLKDLMDRTHQPQVQ